MNGWGNCEYEDAEEIDSQRDYAESHNSCKQ